MRVGEELASPVCEGAAEHPAELTPSPALRHFPPDPAAVFPVATEGHDTTGPDTPAGRVTGATGAVSDGIYP